MPSRTPSLSDSRRPSIASVRSTASTRSRIDTPTSSSPSSPRTPSSSSMSRKSWKPAMPSILSKIRTSMQQPAPNVPEGWKDPQAAAREDDDRLLARLRAGYPCEDVRCILRLASKHYSDLGEQVDFVGAWVGGVRDWHDTIVEYMSSLSSTQRPAALALRAQVDTYFTLSTVMSLEHARTGAQLKVAEELLNHASIWIAVGRDRTHKRFEDFERASETESKRGSGSTTASRHDDVAGNLESIANFLNELTAAEARLPHLYGHLEGAVAALSTTQSDVDGMVRAVGEAKDMIDDVIDGSAWWPEDERAARAAQRAELAAQRAEQARQARQAQQAGLGLGLASRPPIASRASPGPPVERVFDDTYLDYPESVASPDYSSSRKSLWLQPSAVSSRAPNPELVGAIAEAWEPVDVTYGPRDSLPARAVPYPRDSAYDSFILDDFPSPPTVPAPVPVVA